ncbi:MAG: hypothetical protein C5B56_01180 [Proteobacteria bacterium]|nr:MAG: hypothetical protein C5B56_01180 [Pseudomonadota bacterium]
MRAPRVFSRISFKLVLIVGISLLGMVVLAPIALATLRAQMIADRQAKTVRGFRRRRQQAGRWDAEAAIAPGRGQRLRCGRARGLV